MWTISAPRKKQHPPRDARFVDTGTVYCPRVRSDIDVERCLLCPWLKHAEVSEGSGWIRCSAPADLSMPRYSHMLTTGRERR